jgi:SagB-type dehydrogenase family enzyme
MEWPDLKNPHPRSEPRQYVPVAWPEVHFVPLAESPALTTPPFASVAESRRTRYSFAPISDEQLGALMQLTCRITASFAGPLSFPQSYRPVPSAGAIHPVHIVLHRPEDPALYRYAPAEHGLSQLEASIDITAMRAAMHEVVSAPSATLLLFVAEPGLTASKYESSASLVWRDAGVLLGMFAMAAEALSLNFSPMGVTGEPWASQLIPGAPLAGVGVAYVGARP